MWLKPWSFFSSESNRKYQECNWDKNYKYKIFNDSNDPLQLFSCIIINTVRQLNIISDLITKLSHFSAKRRIYVCSCTNLYCLSFYHSLCYLQGSHWVPSYRTFLRQITTLNKQIKKHSFPLSYFWDFSFHYLQNLGEIVDAWYKPWNE